MEGRLRNATMLDAYKKLTNSIVGFVNSQQKLGRRTQNAIVPRDERVTFVESLKWAFVQNLTLDRLSEASFRLKIGKMLATTESTLFSQVTEDAIGIFSLAGQASLEQKAPPRHIGWHQAIYQNQDYDAVLYCHPAAALVMAQKRSLPDMDILMDGNAFLGTAKITEPDAGAILKNAGEANLLLIPQYGLISTGSNLAEAITRAVIFNRLCEAAAI